MNTYFDERVMDSNWTYGEWFGVTDLLSNVLEDPVGTDSIDRRI